MAGKRAASSKLDYDNWDQEDEPEDDGAGCFQKASVDQLKGRVIKSARRRVAGSIEADGGGSSPLTKNAFSGFTGFGIKSTADAPASKVIFKPLGTVSSAKTMDMESQNTNEVSQTDKQLLEYHAQLKGLNECVSKWIKQHVDANPICILTPIFKEYEKYLKEIEEKRKHKTVPEEKPKEIAISNSKSETSPQPLVSFNFNPASTPTAIPKSPFSLGWGKSTIFGQNLSSAALPGSDFGASKPFRFGNEVCTPNITSDVKQEDNKEDEPPKVEFTPVVEQGSIFTIRCKVFFKKDGAFNDRGVGNLYLKPVPNSEKVQLIVRADTNLGNLLVNMLLTESIPTQLMGKNNVMMVCIPTPDSKPPPFPILLRVKTEEEAEELLKTLNKHKK